MNFYYYSKYNGKSTIEQLRRVTFFVSSSSFHIVYYLDDDPSQEIQVKWRSHAYLLFSNWLNYYVYQETPYDLSDLHERKK